MDKLVFNNREYQLDHFGFLANVNDWDENFAEGMAHDLEISNGLTDNHKKVLNYIRDIFKRDNTCPTVYDTMEHFNFNIGEFRSLFPMGYQRGACRLAGISYDKGYLTLHSLKKAEPEAIPVESKSYRVNAKGFLVDWTEWDKEFALNTADELKMPDLLTDKHWEIINYLRQFYSKEKTVPNIYQLCDDCGITLDELKSLFPDGYHRGAVKIAGLRIK
ncbi:MAG: TusE/DsrC/DsvC family sulfur relay protein [Ignavibacteriae bacterium]|nr:TusE/DsrC/DsvC family sulfur relay protein [Ignavibacteriota bacterium]